MALAGERILASDIRRLLDPPHAQVTQTVAQSIPNNTFTAITFDSEDYDNDTIHSTSVNTSRLTIVTAGRYLVSGGVAFVANATGIRDVRLVKNGATLPQGSRVQAIPSASIATHIIIGPLLVSMIATDFIEIQGLQTSGGALNTSVVNGLFSWFRAIRVTA